MEYRWIVEIGIVLLAAKAAGEVFRLLRTSRVVGEIAVGALLGIHALGWVQESHALETLAEVGVLVMIMSLGLETRLDQLREVGAAAVAAALGGIALPMVLGVLTALAFDYSWAESLFIGAVFCATSIAVSTRVLIDLGLGRSRAARLILAAAVLDDIVGILVLAAVVAATGGGDAEEVSLGIKLVMMGSFLLIGIPVVHRIFPLIYGQARRLSGSDAGFVVAFGMMMVFAWSAYWSGLEPILGAFFAGVALSSPPFGREVDEDLEPFVRVLAPVFFVSIGLSLDPEALARNLTVAIVLTVVAVVSKVIGCGLPARLAGLSWREAGVIGVGMVPRGEVGLIIAGLAFSTGALDAEAFSAATFVCVATILVVPPVLRWLSKGMVDDAPAELGDANTGGAA